MTDFYIIKILLLTTLAFVFTISWTPLLTYFLYKYKLGKQIRDDSSTPLYSKMHAHKSGTPTMGGLLVWLTVLIFSLLFFYASKFLPWEIFKNLNFLSRNQTLLPLGCLVASALVGLADDFMDVRRLGYKKRGIKFSHKLIIYTIIAMVGAWWFYFKLDWDIVHLPFLGNFHFGWMYIVFFVAVVVGTAFAVNQTDGLDGLAGGTLIMAFAAYGVISFAIGRYDLATFCGVVAGALLAFLWFNINPARFIMGDTGSISLGVTLALIAFYTNTVFILPFLGFIFVIEAISTVIQILSKKLRHGKKVFLSAPIHHHFEAKGWPEPKIVMRFWVIAGVSAVIGLVIFLLDKTM
ncbi:phospho-N-acetylmuramoyl-pentapeptide-transferase [Patescibacteria group bacterium]|nr:phospho-N-acetylmuramoyl-pentapeptide-transferase [Candidatus Falkowbacteria bacterium]MBU3905906.1 phospho-N-acetylmuramoyl-pentapeptide-transferase [Patescibacteria group bacterium]MCG2698159.1 phospho-N-acetylmuramoyl-pentapeptide-transferase [Candidatus Parcubacteria bacterium]MBU4014728.1 phospho-N-acetylmuramoyl-pentapeptide-transferase [Patescibacteria group bacterium]MBU4026697.1 phospho-N-acetylmuramoyl-pentapeptide-transferase [Patescibacteria group bacterium]